MPKQSIDYTNDLNEFCAKHKIELIGQYVNVKNTTSIYLKCSSCGIQIKKSYKNLTVHKDNDFIASLANICHKCFRHMMH